MTEITLATKRKFSIKTWLVWSFICFIFAFTSVPFVMNLQGKRIAQTLGEMPFSIPVMMTINAGINGIMAVILSGLGLLMASRIGKGLPFIEKAINKKPIWHKTTKYIAIGMIVGLAVSAMVIEIDALIFAQPLTNILEPTGVDLRGLRPPFWQGLLAAFSAGVIEETLFRLFAMTLFMWVGHWVSSTDNKRPTLIIFVIANILAALLFALTHIGNLSLFDVEPTTAIIIRILVLNSILALPMGWLYWRFGLETAVIGHTTTDIIVVGVGTFASNASTQSEALVIYVIAHLILLSIAGLLWFWKPKQTSTKHLTTEA